MDLAVSENHLSSWFAPHCSANCFPISCNQHRQQGHHRDRSPPFAPRRRWTWPYQKTTCPAGLRPTAARTASPSPATSTGNKDITEIGARLLRPGADGLGRIRKPLVQLVCAPLQRELLPHLLQ